MSQNEESNDKGKEPNDHDEMGLLRDKITGSKLQVEECVRTMERSATRLSALEERVASIESQAPSAALAKYNEEIQKEINELKGFVRNSALTVAQHEHSGIQALQTNTQSLNTSLTRLKRRGVGMRTRLRKVEKDLKEQETKLINKLNRFAAVIAVLGGILALGTGLLTLPKTIKEFRSKPETQLVSGWPLEMSYDPTSKRIGFTFSVKLANYGGKGDTIKEVRASFRPNSIPADKAHFLTSGIKFTEKGVDVRTPFDVSTSSPRELLCTMTAELGDNNLQSYIQPGLNRLHVELIGDDGGTRASADYCFWVLGVQVTDLEAAKSLKSFSYVAPYQKC